MTPPSLPPSPSDEPLETLLRKNPARFADDGFSARVLSALPPPTPKPRLKLNRRLVVCCAGGLAGLACASVQSGFPRVDEFASLLSSLWTSVSKLDQVTGNWPALAITAAMILLCLAIAFSREIRERFDRQ